MSKKKRSLSEGIGTGEQKDNPTSPNPSNLLLHHKKPCNTHRERGKMRKETQQRRNLHIWRGVLLCPEKNVWRGKGGEVVLWLEGSTITYNASRKKRGNKTLA